MQENLFTPSPEYLKEMNQATEASVEQSFDNSKEAWREHALRCVEAVAKRQKEFTINEVRDLIHAGKYKTHDNRAVGGVMKTAQKLGIIEPTGRSIPSIVGHRVHIQIWRSLITDKTGNYTIPTPPKKAAKPEVKREKVRYEYDAVRNCMVAIPVTENPYEMAKPNSREIEEIKIDSLVFDLGIAIARQAAKQNNPDVYKTAADHIRAKNDVDNAAQAIKDHFHQELQKARGEAIKPYQDGIKQMAKDLRETGFKKTADIIERDLAVLDASYQSELDQPTWKEPTEEEKEIIRNY